ncbi:MAG TPA: GntG family PLP-dependent aldolase [Acidimicrobiales bacterium]|nr:GntG family PLP-dependent aldolase [Acidimicrobiales bacterium]
MIDLRSDTVTRPTAEMRRAMASADVGDDVYGEDPTVNALQDAFAERIGKEAALFVPSGTMGNQLAVRLLTRPGDVVVAGERQHVVIYEGGAAGRNAGVQFHTVADEDGTLAATDVAWAVDAAAHHHPKVGLVCVENTHMPASGAPWPLERARAVYDVAAQAGLPVHLDGARLFHAEVATGVSAADYASGATTVMCCLSKGLCAPVGSMLAGPADVMAAARAERSRLGGGMRQAGVIAAAGLVALRTMVERLADDHRRAAQLAEAVAGRWPDAGCDPAAVRTNIVTFGHRDPASLLSHLEAEGVLAGTIAPGVVRLVTHHDVDDLAVERACKALVAAP